MFNPLGLLKAQVAEAHCDIPCGIYDPIAAKIAAQTVQKMVLRMQALEEGDDHVAYANTMSRYVGAKEEHAELCKRELRILWGDYFRPEHVEQHPDLHDHFFSAMKLASRVRQNNDMQAAQDLLAAVQGIAETFWETKGASTTRQPSRQGAAGGELVYPA